MIPIRRKSVLSSKFKRQSLIILHKRDLSEISTLRKEVNYERNIKKMKLNELNKSIRELLIDELQKAEVKEITPVPILKRRTKDFQTSMSLKEKLNLDVIIYLLERLKNFYFFIMFNAIQFNDLKKLATHIKYAFYPKGSYIFHTRERSHKFFCIIKGLVSMTKRIVTTYQFDQNIHNEDNKGINDSTFSEYNFISKDSSIDNHKKPIITLNELRSQFEIEQCRYSSGKCFGDWNLINNTSHTTSAYCIEDTHVFYLTKEHFDSILSIAICQASIRAKAFIINCVPLLSQEDLNHLKPEEYDKGAIIYTQYTKAEEVFIVYMGECVLTHDYKSRNMDEILEKRNKKKIISIVNKGGIVGLEAYEPHTYYEDNFEVSKNCTVLYRLNIKEIEKRTNIREYLKYLKEVKRELYFSSRNNQLTKVTKKKKNVDSDNDNIIVKITNLMHNTHNKIKNFNEFKPKITHINYTNLYALKTEGNNNNSKRPFNIKRTCFIKPGLSRNKQASSRNCFSNQLNNQIDENDSMTWGSNSKFRTCTSGNELINNIKSFDKNNKILIKPYLNTVEKKKKKRFELIKEDVIIKMTMKQLTRDRNKKIVYNTGKYNLPLCSNIQFSSH